MSPARLGDLGIGERFVLRPLDNEYEVRGVLVDKTPSCAVVQLDRVTPIEINGETVGHRRERTTWSLGTLVEPCP